MRRAWQAQAASPTGRGRGGAFPRVDGEVNIIFRGHGSQANRRQQKLNDRQALVATTSAPAPHQWSEFLRFEVVSFDCGYNTIIGRPGLAKFMAIPHYSYMILKMP
jgi:hypothetical protein